MEFKNGQLDAAEYEFKKYAMDEKDEIKLEYNKAIYLLHRFMEGKDDSAIDALEKLASTAKTETNKFKILTWLSFCLSDGMQKTKEIDVWKKAIDEIKSQPLVTKAVVNLAYSLNREKQHSEARNLLVDRLSQIQENDQKAIVFEALSEVEESVGNKIVSVYCKDKSLEYDPNNRGELFNSAYASGNEGIDDISISNYIRLIRIDSDNSMVLNNLGVCAQEAGLNINAIENYKKAAEHNNTLAMSNQGHLLLDAGFTQEAEDIANKALNLENTHRNIHILITAINDKKDKQKNEWSRLIEKSLNRQELIRNYTEQYYLGDSKALEGEWFTGGSVPTYIAINNDKLEASWESPAHALNRSTYTTKLSGRVAGSTFSGEYIRNKNDDSPPTLLTARDNSRNKCIGFISDDGNKLTLIESKIGNDFSLHLTRSKP